MEKLTILIFFFLIFLNNQIIYCQNNQNEVLDHEINITYSDEVLSESVDLGDTVLHEDYNDIYISISNVYDFYSGLHIEVADKEAGTIVKTIELDSMKIQENLTGNTFNYTIGSFRVGRNYKLTYFMIFMQGIGETREEEF